MSVPQCSGRKVEKFEKHIRNSFFCFINNQDNAQTTHDTINLFKTVINSLSYHWNSGALELLGLDHPVPEMKP